MDSNPKGTKVNFGLVIWVTILLFVLCIVCVLLRVRLDNLLDQYVSRQVSQQGILVSELINEKLRVGLDALEGMARRVRGEPEHAEMIIRSGKAEDGSSRLGVITLDGELYLDNPADTISVKDFRCVKDAFRGKRSTCYHHEKGLLIVVPIFNKRNVHNVLYRLMTKTASDNFFDGDCTTEKCLSALLDDCGFPILESRKGEWWNDSIWRSVDYSGIYSRLGRKLDASNSAVLGEDVGDERFYFYRVELKDNGFSLMGMVPKNKVAGGIERIPFLVFWVVGLLVAMFLMGVVIWFIVDRKRREYLRMHRESYSSDDLYQEQIALLRNAGEEIHAPVVNILGMSSVLLKESNESTVHECARDIQRSGQLLLTLSENIVDITKVESDAIEIEMVEYDLFTVLSSCYSLAKSQNKEPRFELKVDNSIPGRLSGDEIRLRQVIENILFESEKFSTSGLATVWVGYELCSDEDTEEWSSDSINLLIRVPDLGTGWTGTGLTLVKQLVYLMHGVIRQDSVEDGPVFTVVLPQKIVKNDPVGDFERRYESLMLSSDNGKKRFYAPKASVLAIDDVLMNLRVMGGMLRDACPHIDSVSNGVEALEKFKSNPYHIIFLAQSMPVIDGMDLLTIMKGIADSPNKDTPIVMLTDSNEAVARGVCKQMGYADFLTEPVREDALLAMLLQYLPKDLVEWSDMELEEPAKEKAPSLEQGGNAANKKMMEVVADAESERPELPDDLEKLMSTGMIEVLVGLECCQKNEALYRKRLVDYAGTYVDSALDAFLKREDYENYRLAMRVLKMKSMYIGAVTVASRAKSLEFACNEGHYGFIRSHHDDLIRQYRKLMQALREFV